MASAAIKKSHAQPKFKRKASIRRGHIWGSTTRSTSCHVEAPKVCALTSCSAGSSAVRMARSRTVMGATPMTIRVTLASSPNPTAMKSIGNTASGGMSDKAATKGAKAARRYDMTPSATPMVMPITALTARPINKRSRLAQVSVQKR